MPGTELFLRLGLFRRIEDDSIPAFSADQRAVYREKYLLPRAQFLAAVWTGCESGFRLDIGSLGVFCFLVQCIIPA